MSHHNPASAFGDEPIRTLSLLTTESPLDVRLATLWRSARLGPVVERLRRHILVGAEHRIDPGQFRMLDIIAAHQPCSLGTVADLLGVNPSTATRAVNQLESDGLVTKVRASHDQRTVNVTMTDHGRAMHRYFVDRAYDVYQQIFAFFDDEEKEQLADFLERMLTSTDRVLDDLDTAATDRP